MSIFRAIFGVPRMQVQLWRARGKESLGAVAQFPLWLSTNHKSRDWSLHLSLSLVSTVRLADVGHWSLVVCSLVTWFKRVSTNHQCVSNVHVAVLESFSSCHLAEADYGLRCLFTWISKASQGCSFTYVTIQKGITSQSHLSGPCQGWAGNSEWFGCLRHKV